MAIERRFEHVARRLYIEQRGTHVEPVCLEHAERSWMRASLDDWSAAASLVAEIRCPGANIPTQVMEFGLTTGLVGRSSTRPRALSSPESQKPFASGHPARINGQGATQVVNAPQITSGGVAWLAPSSAGRDGVSGSTMVHWAEIERLQTMDNSAGTGARGGAVGGNGAGVLAATAGGGAPGSR
jgi:hypothetical protein